MGDREYNLAFVFPNGDSLSGVITWSTAMARELAASGKAVTIIKHMVPSAAAGAPALQGTRLLSCGPGNPYFGLLRDVPHNAAVYRQAAPATIIPNWSRGAYAACAAVSINSPDALRVIGYAHSDERAYYQVLSYYEPVVHRIVAVSREIAAKLKRRLPHRAADILMKPYSVDVPAKLRRPPAEGPLRLVYAGRLQEGQKRVMDLLRLAEALQERNLDFRLRIVGSGAAAPRLAQRVAHMPEPLRRRITLEGSVPHAHMADVWSAADVCVLVSAYEGTSLSMLEAMAHGCVPVVTRVSGTADVIRTGENGYTVPVGNVRAMADVLAGSATQRSRLAAMGRAAHELVASRHGHASYAQWLRDLDRRLWEEPARRWPANRGLVPRRGRVENLVLTLLRKAPPLLRASGRLRDALNARR